MTYIFDEAEERNEGSYDFLNPSPLTIVLSFEDRKSNKSWLLSSSFLLIVLSANLFSIIYIYNSFQNSQLHVY